MRVFCDFARVRDILDEFHRQGIERAEFCLVGWNRGGHDGRYPQIFPVEPALGGEAELRKTIRHGQSLGYQIVAHDCYYGAYRISEDWSEDYMRKQPDGELRKGAPGAAGGATISASPGPTSCSPGATCRGFANSASRVLTTPTCSR